MRPLVSWMTKSDPAILELFEESGLSMPPAVVSYNIEGVSHPTVKRRLPILAEHGLLEKAGDKRGYYRITDRGRAYLEGEVETEELEDENE
ncbi:ArsR family transcriptional regulator [Halogeometricum borinquense]|uniref:ArsR family transcriptional regulator n=1 Tax=Halogeometricum borinquense TaxID=60847 RepID=A0A6C0UKG0_9EURY|nr:ArsR family transcriptional regulator [Halogeometricum borinquense]QIB75737.1 ArsR family transcriptional regulator [Halogeometricum borinquense]